MALPAHAQTEKLNKVPVTWFEEPERHGKHWKVQIGPSFLTYSQRFAIALNAEFTIPKDSDAQRTDLYFVVRVADSAGKWYPGSDQSYLDVPALPKKSQTVGWSTGVLVRPGKYQVVLLVYDRRSGEH